MSFFDVDIYNAKTEPLPGGKARSPSTQESGPQDSGSKDEDDFWNLVE